MSEDFFERLNGLAEEPIRQEAGVDPGWLANGVDANKVQASLDVVLAFIDSVRDCLKKGGWAKKNSDREEGGRFLVGVRGVLYTVYEDYQVGRAADGFAAVGSGEEPALGALFATQDIGLGPRRRVRIALAAAERFSAGVRAPFVVKSL